MSYSIQLIKMKIKNKLLCLNSLSNRALDKLLSKIMLLSAEFDNISCA